MGMGTGLTLRTTLDGLAGPERAGTLFLPALAGTPDAILDLLALLPVCDVNGALTACLAGKGIGSGPAPVAAVFCTDPFLRVSDMAETLRAAGLRRVANYPSVQAIDGEPGRTIAAVGYGPDEEIATLVRLREAGLEPLGCAASAAFAARLDAAGIAPILAVPALGSGVTTFAPLPR
ncbi:phosphoenolpyruvate hydrolase family protein [Methylobacterium sp. NEAU 140]|uniref:phosphoenolpyruvate hydrolase family protein n=1 Tax=Methylobacterium sp. NEAU 140 TaxID=3064945 RepID=UPI0027340D5D|nr:phosphoenolpyruvate hydrolase family protein [Methylobacterium sp. NEAU 140]MDP4026459.1 phosphoenolpyruvate hydrolase family protein [Methylobacterium sp. NEAU 140]